MTWLDDQDERLTNLRNQLEVEQPVIDLLYDIAEFASEYDPGCIGANDLPPKYYGNKPEPSECHCGTTWHEETRAKGFMVTLGRTLDQTDSNCDPDLVSTARRVEALLSQWGREEYRADLVSERNEILLMLVGSDE